MSKYRGPQIQEKRSDAPAAAPPPTIALAPLGFLPHRQRRFLCFECLWHAPFLSREALKAHMDGGHQS